MPGCRRLTLAAPGVAAAARPGQFLHVRCGNTLDPLLRRPISINAVDREKGEVAVMYRVAGRGTALLAGRREGEAVSLLGPLGNGFSMPRNGERVSAVAGGIGIAPLFFLLQELKETGIHAAVFLGAATKGSLLLVREISDLGHAVLLSTDDGSEGFHGAVTDLFYAAGSCPGRGGAAGACLPEGFFPPGRVYGCGPRGMLARLCEIIEKWGIPGEVSLEERMGCGVGACLSCACKTRHGEGGYRYRRVCAEGPVFPAGEVVWQ
ncbi:2-polyprenylphenol hydroxylase and related flavodoxin oxidoreductases [Pelotomaculum thermopropionicum SI]|uniref:2-polyprenylphenol hydroxylase and related flavodoxin oxidoreductases n=1 Tax=Pelotomaculum thermopropionicum (strain DSM 13744 / JCM 10971 / SI) TaxID=370438 RepID=A5D1A0_PELTS|nr:2-polyprenylphenol hydroxylase and related flavodoxin oxidoreductases [Pelotomaculum thermopropionicum SI]